MRIISWNCRGLGNPRAVRALKELVRQQEPQVLFLIETKLEDRKLDRIRRSCLMNSCFAVSSVGRSGGLAMMWDESVDLELCSYSHNHIDMNVLPRMGGDKWRLTGFYGEPDANRRSSSWNLLCLLANQSDLRWLCFGDFNEILWNEEKEGGRLRPENLMRDFHTALDDCQLFDLGYSDGSFTWRRGSTEANCIQERLDRFLATSMWSDGFPKAVVHHLSASISDHFPILLQTEEVLSRRSYFPRRKRKYFEVAWCKEPECDEMVCDLWDSAAGNSLGEKIIVVRDGLRQQFDVKFRGIRRKIEELTKHVQFENRRPISDESLARVNSCRDELNRLLEAEESFWMQRSRVNWLRDGDRNTAYFHSQASKRKKRNEIKGLEGDDGQWYDDPTVIQNIAMGYFKKLFKSNGTQDYDDILEVVQP